MSNLEIGAIKFRASTTPLPGGGSVESGGAPGYVVLLGQATVTGEDNITITLDQNVPANGSLHVVFSTVLVGSQGDQSQPADVTDTASATWVVNTTTKPLIGLARDDTTWDSGWETGDPFDTLQVGSVARACTAGDLSTGDTVTVTWENIGWEGVITGTFHISALLVWVDTPFTVVRQDGNIVYNDGDGYQSLSADPSKLQWSVDIPFETVHADESCLMLTALGAYPGETGITPLGSTLAGEVSATCSIACSFSSVVAEAAVEPGASWPGTHTILAGNYQFMGPINTFALPSTLSLKSIKFRAFQSGDA